MKKVPDIFYKNRNLMVSIISIAFIIAIFVCALCDFVINHSLTWSLYPIASCVFAWLILIPLIKLKKHNALIAMIIFTVLLIPFLFFIEYACPVKNWAMPLGVPIGLISLAYIWVTGLLHIKSKLRKWYTASIAVLLAAPVSYFINRWVSEFTHEQGNLSNIINALSIVCVALVFFFIGFAGEGKSRKAE